MRAATVSDGLKVHAVAGTYVVLLGFDLPEEDCPGLLGFSIHRVDHTEDEAGFLTGMKCFAATDPGFPAGAHYTTREHPIQSFQWSDYSAKPGHRYTYAVTALKGTPAALVSHAKASVEITTESPETGDHDVYFNRGVAASQEYARRFGDRAPDKVPNRAAFIWLSRGLAEAMEDYVRRARPGTDALRIAAYEFRHLPFVQVVRDAVDRGVDVKVVYDARDDKTAAANRAAVATAGLEAVCTERTQPKSPISHNKVIVKIEDGEPVSVWTGGTNFSEGGIYGHSNVAHVVEDPAVARLYLDYWTLVARDLPSKVMRAEVEALSPRPVGRPPAGTTVLFSPRPDLGALEWYAQLARDASDGLFMTFAFGLNDLFKDVYRTSRAPLRMALLEKKTRSMRAGPEKVAEERAIQELRNRPENVFAIGSFIRTNAVDGWVKERLSGLNANVSYVHNKFMLIDPLGDDPIVVAGSANFSEASTKDNDENMVVVRGNTRVADIYLGEFMRLYSHHAFRESLAWRNPGEGPKALATGDWWQDSYGDTPRSVRRRWFART